VSDSESFSSETLENQKFIFSKPNFYWLSKIHASIHSQVSILNYESRIAVKEEINFLKSNGFVVPSEINSDLKVTKGGNDVFIVLNLFPFVMVDGIVNKITILNVLLEPVNNSLFSKEKSTVPSSVLTNGSGLWYKIGVRNDGIYKIDKVFLEECGISTTGLNSSSINIFGNGDGKLPELNSVPRTDDLAKNAIYISGDSDGSFDSDDYILFYAWGPNRWESTNSNEFKQDKNIYSDISYYFININPLDTPLRISSINSSPNPISHIVNTYSFYDTYESDLISLYSGGQRWYGELFDSNLDQTFPFSVPNIDASNPAKFIVSMASNSSGSSSTSQVYKINGTQISSSALPSGNYGRTNLSMSLSNPSSSLPLEIIVTRNSPSVYTFR
jgi:hypothetical protein